MAYRPLREFRQAFTRLDTPPLSNRRHPGSDIARQGTTRNQNNVKICYRYYWEGRCTLVIRYQTGAVLGPPPPPQPLLLLETTQYLMSSGLMLVFVKLRKPSRT